MKRLSFETQPCYPQNIRTRDRAGEHTNAKLAPAETDNHIKGRRMRWEGLRLKGEKECSHQSYDLVFNMAEKDTLMHLAPEKFAARRRELLLCKTPK